MLLPLGSDSEDTAGWSASAADWESPTIASVSLALGSYVARART